MKDIAIITHQGKEVVSALEVYLGLGLNKTHWKRWSKQNIESNPFALESVDWEKLRHDGEINSRGPKLQDYALTITFAKKLAMQVRTPAGEEVRDYFIAIERKMKLIADIKIQEPDLPKAPRDMLGMMEMSIKVMREQDRRITEVEKLVKIVDSRTRTNPDYFTIIGWATLHSISINIRLAAALGRKAKQLAAQYGLPLDTTPDPRFGRVNLYPAKVLQEAFSDIISLA